MIGVLEAKLVFLEVIYALERYLLLTILMSDDLDRWWSLWRGVLIGDVLRGLVVITPRQGPKEGDLTLHFEN